MDNEWADNNKQMQRVRRMGILEGLRFLEES